MSGTVDMKLEVVVIPASDVDRAKRFYQGLGWREDVDIAGPHGYRAVHLTPPGSSASILIGNKGVTLAEPGSIAGLLLAVHDIDAARAELISQGVGVSEVFHDAGGSLGGGFIAASEARAPGLDPLRRSYASYASFSDPDGNGWLLQEVTTRLPGRVDFERYDLRIRDGPGERAPPRGARTRRTREAHRSTRCGLAGLVRRLPSGGTIRRSVAVVARPLKRSNRQRPSRPVSSAAHRLRPPPDQDRAQFPYTASQRFSDDIRWN